MEVLFKNPITLWLRWLLQWFLYTFRNTGKHLLLVQRHGVINGTGDFLLSQCLLNHSPVIRQQGVLVVDVQAHTILAGRLQVQETQARVVTLSNAATLLVVMVNQRQLGTQHHGL
jgi:hypothetical protein